MSRALSRTLSKSLLSTLASSLYWRKPKTTSFFVLDVGSRACVLRSTWFESINLAAKCSNRTFSNISARLRNLPNFFCTYTNPLYVDKWWKINEHTPVSNTDMFWKSFQSDRLLDQILSIHCIMGKLAQLFYPPSSARKTAVRVSTIARFEVNRRYIDLFYTSVSNLLNLVFQCTVNVDSNKYHLTPWPTTPFEPTSPLSRRHKLWAGLQLSEVPPSADCK